MAKKTGDVSGHGKRRHYRGYSIHRVTYGLDAPIYKAPAQRPSISGIFIATNNVVFSKGVELVMDVEIKGATFRVRGIVRHALKVEAQYMRMAKPGMGIEFIDPPEELVRALEVLQ
jgi:hypothetical protein